MYSLGPSQFGGLSYSYALPVPEPIISPLAGFLCSPGQGKSFAPRSE